MEISPPINGPHYLFEYEDRIIESRKRGGVNFVREDIIDVERWGELVRIHTEKFIERGIIIQYTLTDGYRWGYGNHKKAIQILKPYIKFIILGGNNEFLDDFSEVEKTINICKDIDDAGFISSAGAWGNSTHGETLAKRFLEQYQPQIVNMHRPTETIQAYKKWIKDIKDFLKEKNLKRPIIQNEFLEDSDEAVATYAKIGFQEGLQGFNSFAGDHLEVMEKISKEMNN